MNGLIYAVGVGPGDPELITRKAERILRSVDVICAPTGQAEAASFALSIVEPYLDRSRQLVIEQVFPMKKEEADLLPFWREAAATVAAHARAGRSVAFITIGDPFLYSTFLYIYRILKEDYPEVAMEIVPGISSVLAAAAAAGIPLGMASDRIAILPATYETDQLRQVLLDFDTVVLMKVHRRFDAILALLTELGLQDSAVYVRRVSSDQEEIVTKLNSLSGKALDYMSLLIIQKSMVSRGEK
ncbi:MAG: precorrin-2 C(20)-methyltransferase [Desulfuromonadales bacterium]|nr:precorrin-2 C(20)-methyltransferase [Desulfuromonadales bacterium]